MVTLVLCAMAVSAAFFIIGDVFALQRDVENLAGSGS
jgi:hypothetical protein